jgi:hypothetical protein
MSIYEGLLLTLLLTIIVFDNSFVLGLVVLTIAWLFYGD